MWNVERLWVLGQDEPTDRATDQTDEASKRVNECLSEWVSEWVSEPVSELADSLVTANHQTHSQASQRGSEPANRQATLNKGWLSISFVGWGWGWGSNVTNKPSVSDWVVQVSLWPSGLGLRLWNRRPEIDPHSRSRRDVTRLSNKRSPYLYGVATANRTKVTTPNKYGAEIISSTQVSDSHLSPPGALQSRRASLQRT